MSTLAATVDTRTQIKKVTQKQLAGLPVFDAALHDEIVETLLLLSPTSFADHVTVLLNTPTAEDRLATSSAMRALGNSELLHYLIPTAVTSARLYYLVAFLEGIVMPELQLLVSLAEEQGHLALGKEGQKELRMAKSKLSAAFSFLSGTGAPALAAAPFLSREIAWAKTDRIPQLRNSVAHFRFRLDEAVTDVRDIPSVQALGPLKDVAIRAAVGLARLLRLPAFVPDHAPDYEKSSIIYEEVLKRPVLPTSRRRSYREVRETLHRVERLGMTMLFAAMDAGHIHQAEGRLTIRECASCNSARRVGVPGTAVTCPACSNSWTL